MPIDAQAMPAPRSAPLDALICRSARIPQAVELFPGPILPLARCARWMRTNSAPGQRAPSPARSLTAARRGGRGQYLECAPSRRLPREPGGEDDGALAEPASEGLVAEHEVKLIGQLRSVGEDSARSVVHGVQVPPRDVV